MSDVCTALKFQAAARTIGVRARELGLTVPAFYGRPFWTVDNTAPEVTVSMSGRTTVSFPKDGRTVRQVVEDMATGVCLVNHGLDGPRGRLVRAQLIEACVLARIIDRAEVA